MADLIKKIKIKKQDGTFTDYIPIGAEAKNVETNDGDSVQLKLNKKPYYYNTVADMKADTKLKTGDMAITLGYYEPNDGGGAEYRIVSAQETEKYYEELNNNLYAEIILHMFVTPEMLGAKSNDQNFDSAPIISRCIRLSSYMDVTVRFNNQKKFYCSTSIILASGRQYYSIKMEGSNGTNSENNRNIVYLGDDAMFVSSTGSKAIIQAIIKGINFYVPRTSYASIFKNIVFSSSRIDTCCFINAGIIFDTGGIQFTSTVINCESLFIKTAIFKTTAMEDLSDSTVINNYFNGKRDTYPSFIIGPRDNDMVFENNFIDYFKYILKGNGYGCQWICNRFEPIFRFANKNITNPMLIGNLFNCDKENTNWDSGTGYEITDPLMINGQWGVFISDPNDTYWESDYAFNFRNLTCIGNFLGRNTRLIYVLSPNTISQFGTFGNLYEVGTQAATDYELMTDAVFFHPYAQDSHCKLFNSKCEGNGTMLSEQPATGGYKNYLNYTYISAETGEQVSVKGIVAFNKDEPKRFIDSNHVVHNYVADSAHLWEF